MEFSWPSFSKKEISTDSLTPCSGFSEEEQTSLQTKNKQSKPSSDLAKTTFKNLTKRIRKKPKYRKKENSKLKKRKNRKNKSRLKTEKKQNRYQSKKFLSRISKVRDKLPQQIKNPRQNKRIHNPPLKATEDEHKNTFGLRLYK